MFLFKMVKKKILLKLKKFFHKREGRNWPNLAFVKNYVRHRKVTLLCMVARLNLFESVVAKI